MQDHDPHSKPHARSSEDAFSDRLAARTDLLSQMLRLVRLQGGLVFSAELSEPWAVQFSPGEAHFHVVLEGSLVIQVGSNAPVRAETGDLVMLPRGLGHIVHGDQAAAPALIDTLLADQLATEALIIHHGGGGAPTRLISGEFRFENEAMPSILAALPHVIHMAKSDGATAGWLEGLSHFLHLEARAPDPGASLMISRLIDLLVVRALRSWAQTTPVEDKGWLGALNDTRISRALKSIHDDPFRRWTVADLARLAGMSRSSFAERFTALVGEAPLRYQARWRLSLAADLLRQGGRRVSDVARHVGYDSDAAFSRAFKAHFGYAPVVAKLATTDDAA